VKKLFIGGMLLAGIIAFAGTCTLQNFQLQQTGSFDTYGGEIHNDTGTNFLQHNVMVAFVDSNGAVVDAQMFLVSEDTRISLNANATRWRSWSGLFTALVMNIGLKLP